MELDAAVAQDEEISSVSLLAHNGRIIHDLQIQDLIPLENDLSVSEKVSSTTLRPI